MPSPYGSTNISAGIVVVFLKLNSGTVGARHSANTWIIQPHFQAECYALIGLADIFKLLGRRWSLAG